MTIKSINGVDVVNTSEMSALLGVSLSVQRIQEAGFEPYAASTTAILWKRKDAAAIAISIADHLLAVSDRINEEYKK